MVGLCLSKGTKVLSLGPARNVCGGEPLTVEYYDRRVRKYCLTKKNGEIVFVYDDNLTQHKEHIYIKFFDTRYIIVIIMLSVIMYGVFK